MNVHFDNLERNKQFVSVTPHFHWELSCGLLQLWLIPSYDWLEFQRLNTSCGWLKFWWLDKSCGWLEFQRTDMSSGWFHHTADSKFLRLDRSCGWFHDTAESSSSGWLWVAADSILWLTQDPPAGFDLWLTYTLIYPVNLRTYSAKYIIFIVSLLPAGFSYHWFKFWLLLQEPWRGLKKPKEASRLYLRLLWVAAADTRPATNRLPPKFWPQSPLIEQYVCYGKSHKYLTFNFKIIIYIKELAAISCQFVVVESIWKFNCFNNYCG